MIDIKVNSSALDALRTRASEAGAGRNVTMVGARAAANLVRQHLFNLDESGANQMGGVRTHFYADAAKSVTEPTRISSEAASFTINKVGLAQRWLGGTITAGKGESSATGGPTRFLAIPARSETYGKTPAEFVDLVFVPRGRDRGMLVQALQTEIVRGRGNDFHTRVVGGLVMYWLVKEVHQEGDPNVMPLQDDIIEAARYHMENYLTRQLQSKGGATNG